MTEIKGASPADKQAIAVAKGAIKHEGKGSAMGNNNGRRDERDQRRKDEDVNPVTGRKETHTRLATPEEQDRMRKGERVTGRPGDDGAKKPKVTDAEAAEKFRDPEVDGKPEATSKSTKEGEEGEAESTRSQNDRARAAALGGV